MDKIAKTKRAMRLQEWSEMYRAYQASGKTVLAWCEEQELSPKTFYYRLYIPTAKPQLHGLKTEQ